MRGSDVAKLCAPARLLPRGGLWLPGHLPVPDAIRWRGASSWLEVVRAGGGSPRNYCCPRLATLREIISSRHAPSRGSHIIKCGVSRRLPDASSATTGIFRGDEPVSEPTSRVPHHHGAAVAVPPPRLGETFQQEENAVAGENIPTPTGDFWSLLGPYLVAACALLIGAVYAAFRENRKDDRSDIKWLKKNLTKVLIKLQIDPESD